MPDATGGGNPAPTGVDPAKDTGAANPEKKPDDVKAPEQPAWQQAGLQGETELEALKSFAQGQGKELDITNARAIEAMNMANSLFKDNSRLAGELSTIKNGAPAAPPKEIAPAPAPAVAPPAPPVTPPPAPVPAAPVATGGLNREELTKMLEENNKQVAQQMEWNTFIATNPTANALKPQIDIARQANSNLSLQGAYEAAVQQVQEIAKTLEGTAPLSAAPTGGMASAVPKSNVTVMTQAEFMKLDKKTAAEAQTKLYKGELKVEG